MELTTKELILLRVMIKEKASRDHLSKDDEKTMTEILIKVNVELGK